MAKKFVQPEAFKVPIYFGKGDTPKHFNADLAAEWQRLAGYAAALEHEQTMLVDMRDKAQEQLAANNLTRLGIGEARLQLLKAAQAAKPAQASE